MSAGWAVSAEGGGFKHKGAQVLNVAIAKSKNPNPELLHKAFKVDDLRESLEEIRHTKYGKQSASRRLSEHELGELIGSEFRALITFEGPLPAEGQCMLNYSLSMLAVRGGGAVICSLPGGLPASHNRPLGKAPCNELVSACWGDVQLCVCVQPAVHAGLGSLPFSISCCVQRSYQ